jgi:hypothetical protein
MGDYEAISNVTVTLNGTTTPASSATLNVTINGDDINEPSESFTVTISNLNVPGTIGTALGRATIVDNDPLSVTIADVSVSESAGTANFAVTFDRMSEQAIIVNFSLALGAAMGNPAEAGDVGATSGFVTFAPGDLNKPVVVTINDDLVNEADEVFTVSISFNGTPDNATVTRSSAVGTILDNDSLTVDILNGVTVLESAGNASFPIQLSLVGAAPGTPGTSEQTIVVDLATGASLMSTAPATGGPGGSGFPTDYVITNSTLTFAPGVSLTNFVVPVVNEAVGMGVNEPVEQFDAILTANVGTPLPARVSLGVSTRQTANITDDDVVTLQVNAPAPTMEGSNGGFTTFNFTVNLIGRSDQTLNVNYRIETGGNNPATANVDFASVDSIITFTRNPNLAMRTENAPSQVRADTINETNQTFQLSITSVTNGVGQIPVNVTISPAQAVATILDDDDLLVRLANANTPVAGEAAEANGAALFRVDFVSVNMANPTTQTEQTFSVVFNALTGIMGGFVHASAPGDFTAGAITAQVTGTPATAVALASQTLSVPIVNDTINEAIEDFRGQITNLQPAGTVRGITIDGANNTTTQTILDNDNLVLALRVQASPVTEGNVANYQVFAFNPGVGANATGTQQRFTFDFATSDKAIPEATASPNADYTARSDNDFVVNNGMATINYLMSDVVATLAVMTLDETIGNEINEAEEGFLGTLSDPRGNLVTLGPVVVAEARITDNDPISFTLAAQNAFTEGDGANGQVTFTVTRTGAGRTEQTFNLNIGLAGASPNTAEVGTDYQLPPMTVTAFAGTFLNTVTVAASTMVNVTIVNDDDNEALNEFFSLILSLTNSPVNVTVGPAATQQIIDDDLVVVRLAVNLPTAEEGTNVGMSTVGTPRAFSLSLGTGNAATNTEQVFQFQFTTRDGQTGVAATFGLGTSPDDYTGVVLGDNRFFSANGTSAAPQALTVLTGQMISVPVIDDRINEADENFDGLIAIATGGLTNVQIEATFNVRNAIITDANDPVELEIVAAATGFNESVGSTTTIFIVRDILSNTTVETEQTFSVNFSTLNGVAVGSAMAGMGDFLIQTNSGVSFMGGQMLTRNVVVTINEDTINETNEQFSGQISRNPPTLPANVFIGTVAANTPTPVLTASAMTLINDNDDLRLRLLSMPRPNVNEGDPGQTITLNFTVERDPAFSATATEQDIFVQFSTLAAILTPIANPVGTPNVQEDYSPISMMQVNIPKSTSIAVSVPVSIIEDELNEPDEFVGARINGNGMGISPAFVNPMGTVLDNRGTSVDNTQVDGVINDDDNVNIIFAVASRVASGTEGDMATVNVGLTVQMVDAANNTILRNSAQTVIVNTNSTLPMMVDVLEVSDFVLPANVTFTPVNDMTPNQVTLTVGITGDNINEANEQRNIVLDNIPAVVPRGVSINMMGGANVSLFTASDDDVLVLRFANATNNNQAIFERGNTGSQTAVYTYDVDPVLSMCASTEQGPSASSLSLLVRVPTRRLRSPTSRSLAATRPSSTTSLTAQRRLPAARSSMLRSLATLRLPSITKVSVSRLVAMNQTKASLWRTPSSTSPARTARCSRTSRSTKART